MSVTPSHPEGTVDFLSGGGDCGAIARAIDWPTTPLGTPGGWPQALASAVSICLNAQFPICIYWGADLTLIYNDAWSPIPGAKHPGALGRPAREVWGEIWHLIDPLFRQVIATGQGTFRQDELLPMHRHGYTEECYFDYTFSPIRGPSGNVEGVFNAVTETTYRVIAARRGRVLRELSAATAAAKSAEDVCRQAANAIEGATHDIPFALLYLLTADGSTVELSGTAGIAPGGAASPRSVSLAGADGPWPFAAVAETGEAVVVEDLSRCGPLPGGPWPEPPSSAVVLPVAATGRGGVAAILVAGVSPRRALDEEYRTFFDGAAEHLATAIANARVYEEERRRAEQLAELDRAKTAFFSNVSHEFRTPLTLLLGPLEDILGPGGKVLPENREPLTAAHRNGQRLLKLVNSLLDFSRIEAGRVQASYEPVDLARYTAELASVFRAAVEKAGLKLVVDCPPLPEPVYVDRDMWEKVVLNLLSNAFKFTLAGEIRVRLRAEGGRAVLTVHDTGTGIPAHELPKLFNRFHRVEGAKGRTHEGSGIGLALVQELARLHGGEVTATSIEGEGSAFTVAVPLGRDHLPADRIAAPRSLSSTAVGAAPFVEEALKWLPGGDEEAVDSTPAESQEPEPSVTGRGRVLLADDNADMRDYVRRLLAGRYAVTAVRDGTEAIEAALAAPPDLVLTDVMMPNLDGFGLLKALRADPRTAAVPVIMLSARAGEEARVEGLEAGADDYLVKPFSARELLAKVNGTLALARARREALQREEELKAETRGALESIADGFITLDRDFRFTYVNAAAERILGMRRDEFLGRTQWELFPGTLGSRTEAEYRKAMAERAAAHFKNYYPPTDRWYELDVYPVPDAGIGVYFRDVTEQQRAAELNARFRALFEQATAVVAETDVTGRFTLVNPRFCELVGYSEAELLTLRMQDITHPDDLPWNLEQNRALVAGGPDFVVEKRYVRKDGSEVWVSVGVNAVRDPSGETTRVVAVTFDLTDRMRAEAALRESEARLAMAQRAASMGTWDWNLVTGELTWSEGLYLLLDMTPEEITPSATAWQEIIHPDDLPEVGRLVDVAIRTGGEFYAEFRARRKDGSYVWVASRGRAYLTDGTPTRFLGVNYDITQRKLVEAQLRESEEQLRDADRRKDEFLALLAHELRNPLAPLRNGLEVLRLVVHCS